LSGTKKNLHITYLQLVKIDFLEDLFYDLDIMAVNPGGNVRAKKLNPAIDPDIVGNQKFEEFIKPDDYITPDLEALMSRSLPKGTAAATKDIELTCGIVIPGGTPFCQELFETGSGLCRFLCLADSTRFVKHAWYIESFYMYEDDDSVAPPERSKLFHGFKDLVKNKVFEGFNVMSSLELDRDIHLRETQSPPDDTPEKSMLDFLIERRDAMMEMIKIDLLDDCEVFCFMVRDLAENPWPINGEKYFDIVGYTGFNAATIARTLRTVDRENWADDVNMMIAFALERGSNLTAIEKKSSKIGKDEIARLIKKYQLKSKAGDDPKAMTLPRVALACPLQSCMYFQKYPKRAKAVNPSRLSKNYPAVMKCQAFYSLIPDVYSEELVKACILYQAEFTKVINKTYKASNYLELQDVVVPYIENGRNSSYVPDKMRINFLNMLGVLEASGPNDFKLKQEVIDAANEHDKRLKAFEAKAATK